MIRLVRSLTTAALALTAIAATPARAHDCEHDRAGDFRPSVVLHVGAPPPEYVIVREPPPEYVPDPPPPVYAPAPEREGFRPAARHEIRNEYRELDFTRERFYASWNGSPGLQRRFERWYAVRRAEIDQRWHRVSMPARWER